MGSKNLALVVGSYDTEAAAERLRATSYPLCEEMAIRYVLNPPTAAETIERFRAAEVR